MQKMSLDTQSWRDLDARHHLHPFTDHKSLRTQGSRIIVRGQGVYIYDSEGQEILDGMAGLWCVNVGYGRKELAEIAAQQMLTLPYYNNFFRCTNDQAVTLAHKLTQLAPSHINNVFFASSGSESNDTVIRLVRRYWALGGESERNIIIARKRGYHGSTIAGASLGGFAAVHEQIGLTLPGIYHIDPPYWWGLGGDLSPEEFGLKAANKLAEAIEQLGPHRVAAFIAEPIQGAGGVIIPPDSYWPQIQRICQHYGILLVADEVITGFGRLGEWFGSQYYHITPDLITVAKGITSGYIPLSAVLVGDRVALRLVEEGGEFYHGYTYSGHPVACAVALKNLDILSEEKLLEHVKQEIGPYFRQRLAELADHPLIGEVRSQGLVGALELTPDKKRRASFPGDGKVGLICRDFCFKNNLVMRAVGDTMILSPPLIFTRQHVDKLVTLARQAFDLTAREVL
jgi:putrescine---pyruvate transaminase